MAKNLVIKETGVNKTLSSIKYVETAKYGGGDVLWMEKDDIKLIKKTIRKKGTFKAKKDGAFGYSEVTVNIKGLKEYVHSGVVGTINGVSSQLPFKSDNITIQEGEVNKVLSNIRGLEIPTSNGSWSKWTSENNLTLKTRTADKNGTYFAIEDDKCYGYSEFTVVVNTNSYTGNDGNEYVDNTETGEDGSDEVVPTLIPSSIKIETPPTKVKYKDGDEIDLTGIVVKAYCGDGTLWVSEGYEGGVIPVEELEWEPQEAEAPGDTEITTDWGEISTSKFSNYAQFTKYLSNPIKNGSGFTWERIDRNGDVKNTYEYFETKKQRVCVVKNTSLDYYQIFIISKENKAYYKKDGQTIETNGSQITIDGNQYYWSWDLVRNTDVYYNVKTPDIANDATGGIPGVTWNSAGGDTAHDIGLILWGGQRTEVDEEITVSWGRPEDGKELTDKFKIKVGDKPADNGGNESGQGGNNSGGGSW